HFYRICPMDQLIEQRPDLMLNISASLFDYDHGEDRVEFIRANVHKYKLTMVYCNAVGSQTEIVYDGGSLVMDAEGDLVKEMKYFEEDFSIVDLDDIQTKPTGKSEKVKLKEFDKEMRVSKVNDPEKIIDYLTANKNIKEI